MLKPLFSAIGFLTVAPVPMKWMEGEGVMERSVRWFIVVGLLLGGFVSAASVAIFAIFPILPAAVMTTALMLAVSGALHMDGLADTADGFFSSRPRERILEIMKDSRTGAMGVVAIVVVFIFKVSLIISLPAYVRTGFIFLMPVAGRFAPVMIMATMKNVREGGLGTVFSKNANAASALIAFAALAVSGWFCCGKTGAAVAVGVVLFLIVYSWWCRKKIGGYTGDTLGAAVELCELIPPFVFFFVSGVMSRI